MFRGTTITKTAKGWAVWLRAMGDYPPFWIQMPGVKWNGSGSGLRVRRGENGEIGFIQALPPINFSPWKIRWESGGDYFNWDDHRRVHFLGQQFKPDHSANWTYWGIHFADLQQIRWDPVERTFIRKVEDTVGRISRRETRELLEKTAEQQAAFLKNRRVYLFSPSPFMSEALRAIHDYRVDSLHGEYDLENFVLNNFAPVEGQDCSVKEIMELFTSSYPEAGVPVRGVAQALAAIVFKVHAVRLSKSLVYEGKNVEGFRNFGRRPENEPPLAVSWGMWGSWGRSAESR